MKQTAADKRVVSKSEYAKLQGVRISLLCGGMLFAAFGCVDAGLALTVRTEMELLSCWGLGIGCGGCFLMAIPCLYYSSKIIEAVIPLTCANAAYLPFSDTLVRASAVSVQSYSALLLRAAAKGTPLPDKQLIRASSRHR